MSSQLKASQTSKHTQPAAPSPTRWRHSDHPEGGQLLSGEHGPIGTVFTVRDAALIVRAVNEREELIAALKSCMETIDSLAQDLQNGESWVEGSEQSECCDESFNLARAVLAKVEGE